VSSVSTGRREEKIRQLIPPSAARGRNQGFGIVGGRALQPSALSHSAQGDNFFAGCKEVTDKEPIHLHQSEEEFLQQHGKRDRDLGGRGILKVEIPLLFDAALGLPVNISPGECVVRYCNPASE
jgi:hypothetical protein